MRNYAEKTKAGPDAVSVPSVPDPVRSDYGLAANPYYRLQRAIGNRGLEQLLQFRTEEGSTEALGNPQQIRHIAQIGLTGNVELLPHLETIQRAFGCFAPRDIRVFVGGRAEEANARLGSSAYTTGGSVAFKQSPTLRTAAHEAAHIVQQRAGVGIPGGVGTAGDRYEQQADAVALAVTNGRSAEPLLEEYDGPVCAHPNEIQFENGPETTPDRAGICEALRSALANSRRVIDTYNQYLAGLIRWEEVMSRIQQIGNAAEGVTGAGRHLPQVVQDAINEVERFDWEEIRQAGRLTIGLLGGEDYFHRQWVTNEIERQNHYNLVLIRLMYENSCPDYPGTWTSFQQQILSIGTRGMEQRSAIESPRETRTALAWVQRGEERFLILAIEVEHAGQLRFERWIDSEFRDLALSTAASRQGSIPTVPASAVNGLPSDVPASAARR